MEYFGFIDVLSTVRMLCPGRFILVESVKTKENVIFCEEKTFCYHVGLLATFKAIAPAFWGNPIISNHG